MAQKINVTSCIIMPSTNSNYIQLQPSFPLMCSGIMVHELEFQPCQRTGWSSWLQPDSSLSVDMRG